MALASGSNRDEEFAAFVRLRGPDLLRAAQFLTLDRHLAEDLLQAALIKAYLAWPAARRPEPYSYVRRILVTTNIDTWRRRRWREQLSDDPTSNLRLGAEADQSDDVVQRDSVLRALALLTPLERAVLVLRFLEDMAERDVARLLRRSVGTVKSTSSRALAKLRLDPTITRSHEEPSCADN